MRYAPPGPPDSIISVGPYKNFIDGKRLDRAWQQEQFLLDAAAGEPEDFSLPAGDNLHFVTRSPTRVSPNAPEESAPSSTALESEWSTS